MRHLATQRDEGIEAGVGREIERRHLARDRRLAKAFRLLFIEIAAPGGEPAHDFVADAVMAERDATPGRMVAERFLRLDHHHLAVPHQPRRRRKPGNAAADDHEIGNAHAVAVSASASSRRAGWLWCSM